MRRTLVLLMASLGLMISVPALALAHHRHHHARHHRSHHASSHRAAIRHQRFGSSDPAETNDNQGQPAGFVDNFTNGVLTITLNDTNHSSVSGMVTNDTNIECSAPSSSTQGDEGNDNNGDNEQNSGEDNSGDDNSGSNSGDDNGSNSTSGDGDQSGGDQSGDDQSGSDQSGDDQSGEDQSGEDQGDGQQMCDSSSLTPTTPVSGAELEITSAGAVWKEVDLITS